MSSQEKYAPPAPPSDTVAALLAFTVLAVLIMPTLDVFGVIAHFTLNLWG